MSQSNNTNSGSNLRSSKISISLCDGFGCLWMVMQRILANITWAIAVENDEVARVMCQNANPATAQFPGVDHSWKSNVFEIAEADIAHFGFNVINFLGLGPPCEDQSKLRLIMSAAQRKAQRKGGKNPRPGLDGPKGAVFRQRLQIALWVKKYNPDAEILAENPDFADLIKSWTEVCDVLGEPLMISHEDFSTTNRFRAY
jgi:hypothetical protein